MRVRSLEDAVKELDEIYGNRHVAWGEVNRLQRTHTSGTESFSDQKPSLPIPSSKGWTGIIFSFQANIYNGLKCRYGIAGDSFVCIVEFAPKVQARSVLVFGQSADSRSLHYFDQAPLYGSGRFKPAWFETPEVEAHTEKAYTPAQAQPWAGFKSPSVEARISYENDTTLDSNSGAHAPHTDWRDGWHAEEGSSLRTELGRRHGADRKDRLR